MLIALIAGQTGCARPGASGRSGVRPAAYRLSELDDRFLEDLSRRSFAFFWEQADARTGIVRDRSRTDGRPANEMPPTSAASRPSDSG